MARDYFFPSDQTIGDSTGDVFSDGGTGHTRDRFFFTYLLYATEVPIGIYQVKPIDTSFVTAQVVATYVMEHTTVGLYDIQGVLDDSHSINPIAHSFTATRY